MKEDTFQYGENLRGFGIVTLPDQTDNAPVVVALNAGLLHRSEPYRLNVMAARTLAELGYICIRVDLSGKGDTPARSGLTNRESVATDWRHIHTAIEKRFGSRPVIIMGLCSGADNAVKLAAEFEGIRGVILLDPISPRDTAFAKRDFQQKISNPYNWLRLPFILLRRIKRLIGAPEDDPEVMGLRDEPTSADLEQCMSNLVNRQGRCIAFFTSHARKHYNQQGQFSRALAHIPGLDNICEEFYWPEVRHLYPVQTHRERLLREIASWGRRHHLKLSSPSAAQSPDSTSTTSVN